METPIKLNGMVHTIGSEQIISDKFKKRELIIETSGKFPQHILVQFTNEKCDLMNNLKTGDSVEIAININGRLWNDPKTGSTRCFNTLNAWSIHLINASEGRFATSDPEKPTQNFPETPTQQTPPIQSSKDDDDDLPF